MKATAMTSYAVIWRENDGPLFAGRLDLSDEQFCLDGTSCDGHASHETIPFAELSEVDVGRGRDERLDGRPSIRVARRHGVPLRLGSVDGRGALVELVDLLTDRERK
jgi:hypothetical protein